MSADDDPSEPPEHGAEAPDLAGAAWQAARDAGLAAAKVGDAGGAESNWLEALELSEALPSPDPRLAQSCEDLGGLCAQLGRHDEAVGLLRRALVVRELFVFPADSCVGETLYQLGWSLWQSGHGREAEPIVRRAIPLAESSHGQQSLRVAHLLNNLALILAGTGEEDDDSEQEQLLRRALSIKEESCGPADPDVAGTLNNLALLLVRRGEAAQAIDLLRRSLDIRQSSLRHDHPDVTETCANLGRLLLQQGRAAEAEPLLRQSAAFERNSERLTDVLEALAAARRSARDYAGAMELMKRSLMLKERRLGQSHPELARTLSNLAGLLGSSGMLPEAEQAGRRALEIRRAAFGPESPAVVHTLQNLARIALRQGDFLQAESLCREALAIIERHAGPRHPTAAEVLEQLAGVLEHRGEPRRAAGLRSRAESIRDDEGNVFMDDL